MFKKNIFLFLIHINVLFVSRNSLARNKEKYNLHNLPAIILKNLIQHLSYLLIVMKTALMFTKKFFYDTLLL